jgi:hypothetical protein
MGINKRRHLPHSVGCICAPCSYRRGNPVPDKVRALHSLRDLNESHAYHKRTVLHREAFSTFVVFFSNEGYPRDWHAYLRQLAKLPLLCPPSECNLDR